MRVSVVVYLCLLALETVNCVPSTLQPSCGTELVRVERGSTLNLQCGSHCTESSEYTWWKMSEQDETRVQLSFSGAVVTEDKITEESGGDYECQCGSSGQICTFYVAVVPEITFTASHTATHYGDVVTLTCLMEGNPANFTTITNSYGILLQSQVKRKINSFRLETTAVVRDIEEEDYECLVELHYKGHPVARKKQSLKIKLYDPPSIVYTTEYALHQEAEFGKGGHLSCVVQTSPDTESVVTWWAGGELLEEEGGKYRTTSSVLSNQVTVFRLEVETVEQSDIGPYLCQLSSQYNIEETQEAWIKVDYRNEASVDVDGGTVTGGGRGGGSNSLDQTSASSLRSVAVLMCLVMVAGLGTWGVLVHRRSWRKARGQSYSGIIGGGQEPQTPSIRPPLGQSSLSVFKRK